MGLARVALALLVCAVPLGCGGGGGPVAAFERSDDPAVVAAREAIDQRRLAEARALVAEVAAAAGAEAPLLAARLAALEGRTIEALRLVREAAAGAPNDPAPSATLVEIHALGARLPEAQAELEAALAVFGRCPELVRAHGVLGLCTPGGARSGLAMLLEAERADPTLPFVDRSIGEGHLLAAHAALGQSLVDDAAEQARLALERMPGDARAREALADALATGADLDGAAALYEGLDAEGLPVRQKLLNTLHNTATATLVAALTLPPESRSAVDARRERLYLRMLELGASRSDIGHGATFLAERAEARTLEALDLCAALDTLLRLRDEGRAAGDVDERIGATRLRVHDLLDEALRLDPECVMARGVRGEALFDERRYREAAEVFEALARDHAGALDALAVPVHLNAARAWARADAVERARGLLEDYLAQHPTGRWAVETTQMLEQL